MKFWFATLASLAALLATGCAIRTSDARGRVTTIGLVWSTHPAPPPATAIAPSTPSPVRFVFGHERLPDPPRWIEFRAAGLIFEHSPHNLGVTLGYKDSLWVFPVADAVTDTARTDSGEPAQVTVSTP